MSDECYIGEIKLLPYGRIPAGWLRCEGQVLQVKGNQALFSLIGNKYGGDGQTTFALPDLRGRTPLDIDFRTSDYGKVGLSGGKDAIALSADQMPVHTHAVKAFSSNGDSSAPANCYPAAVAPSTVAGAPPPPSLYAQPSPSIPLTTLAAGSVGSTGGGGGHENRQPSIALNYCIATRGLYPQRAD